MIDTEHDAVVRELLAMTNVTPEQFCEMNAVSQKQRDYANNLKITACAVIWQALKEEKKTLEMATALVKTIREKQEAAFWCDHQLDWVVPRAAMGQLRVDLKKNLEGYHESN